MLFSTGRVWLVTSVSRTFSLTCGWCLQVLEMDLAVFGFFAVLGRNTRAYLASKGVSDSEESVESLLR